MLYPLDFIQIFLKVFYLLKETKKIRKSNLSKIQKIHYIFKGSIEGSLLANS